MCMGEIMIGWYRRVDHLTIRVDKQKETTH